MESDDRVERLERRLHDLEELVLDLQAALKAATPPPKEVTTGPRLATKPGARIPLPREPGVSTSPSAFTVRSSPTGTVPSPRTPPTQPSALAVSAEQWIGQRGLLAAGVFLLILAAGYFLKLAFDRGWISPLLRCTGGAIFGLAVAAWGWRIHEGRLRTYGAALMGCGAAIVYLAVWAAVSLYGLLSPTIGLGLMATVSVGVFGLASLINVEALAAAATVGAFLAPAMVSRSDNPDLLLLYASFLAVGLGAVAQRRWRVTTFLIALSFFALGSVAASSSHVGPANVLMYAVIGASVGLYIGLRERWTETRFLAFSGGWLLLWMSVLPYPQSSGRLIAAGGIILAAAIWWHAWRSPTVWPDEKVEGASLRAESLYFYVTPLLLIWAIMQAAPIWLDRHEWVAWLLVGVPYLAAGYLRPRIPFAIVGTTLVGFAALSAWDGLPAVWALLALSMVWALLDHQLDRRDGRWYALIAASAALYHLISFDLANRGSSSPAFVDGWAISLWLGTAVVAELAAGLWWREPAGERSRPAKADWQGWDLDDLLNRTYVPPMLWVLSGTLLFAGVSNELTRLFHQVTMNPANARLAGGLAVSAWWAVFAAGLVILGFRRNQKPVRVAGLLVSGLAVAKVLLFDLSELDALYRVASVFILGLVSLGVAYLYHRQARDR